MRKLLHHIIILAFLAGLFVRVQAQKGNIRERLIVHLSTQTVITGEDLAMSVFLTSDLTNKPAKLSKILYLELVSDSGTHIKKKLEFENSMVSLSLFIPGTLSTGTYQLQLYTQWMRNFDDILVIPLNIINPFEKYTPGGEPANQVQFFRDSQEIYPGRTRQLLVKLPGEKKYSGGRVINAEGETVQLLDISNKGWILIEEPFISPNLELVLESSTGQFEFKDIPVEVRKTPGMYLNFKQKSISLDIPEGDHHSYELQYFNSNGKLFAQAIPPSGELTIPTNIIKDQLVKIVFTHRENGAIDFRWYKGFPEKVKDSGSADPLIFPAESPEIQLAPGRYTLMMHEKSTILGKDNENMSFTDLTFHFPEWLSLTDGYTLQDILENWPFLLMALPDKDFHAKASVELLPEYEWEIISGTAFNVRESIPEAGLILFSSSPLNNEQISTTQSDSSGRFHLLTERQYVVGASLLRPMNADTSISLEIEEKWIGKWYPVSYLPMKIEENDLEDIKKRTILAQIKDVYSRKEDTEKIRSMPLKTLAKYDHYYVFDDYVRFETMKEHFVEYVSYAKVRRNKILVNREENLEELSGETLVLLDGIPISSEEALSIDPRLVKGIGIFTRPYLLGGVTVESMINIETFEKSYDIFPFYEEMVPVEIIPLEPRPLLENYQDFLNQSRIPKFTRWTSWHPGLMVYPGTSLSLGASHPGKPGNYLWTIMGVSDDGKLIYSSREIVFK